jgi:stage II sporulation protein M
VFEFMLIMPREERRAYLRQLMPYLRGSLTLFTLGIVLGVAAVYQAPALVDPFVETLANFIKTFTGMPQWKLAIAIFLNNSLKTLMAILLGTVLGIMPVLFLLANGIALGLAFSLSLQARGLWASLVSIVPHGVFELPAVFLGTSIGLMLGIRSMRRLLGRPDTMVNAGLSHGLKYYFTVILPLLALAALVEAFVTAALVPPR